MQNNPKTIQIFLPNGDSNDIKISTIRTRNIEVIYCPRNNLENLYKIMEKRNKIAVYFLVGFNEEKNIDEIYVGETEDIIERLKQHNKNKDFWQKVFFVIDKNVNNNRFLTKSDVKYLENLFYNKIKSAEKVSLNNDSEPTKSNIDETTEADLNGDVLEAVEILLSLLMGDNIFKKYEENKKNRQIFMCKDNKGVYAEGEYVDNGFMVFKGAKIRLIPVDSYTNTSEEKMRNFLINNNFVTKENDFYILKKDYLFKSPSQASGVILGHNSNGWIDWKNKNGETLNDVYRK